VSYYYEGFSTLALFASDSEYSNFTGTQPIPWSLVYLFRFALRCTFVLFVLFGYFFGKRKLNTFAKIESSL
jgi:hypothetical protein